MFKNLIRSSKTSMGIFDSNADGVYGLLAEFSNPSTLLHAAADTHQAGYTHYDAHSPFPIHGMDKAMGLGNSKIGYVVILGGATGLALATWLQWWTSQIDYPINISGKPFFAVEPSIPVMFELTILFAAFAAVAAMFAFNGLPRPYNPLFYSEAFTRVTDDGFFLHIAASDAQFDQEKTTEFLKRIGAMSVEVIHDLGVADMGGTPEPAAAAPAASH